MSSRLIANLWPNSAIIIIIMIMFAVITVVTRFFLQNAMTAVFPLNDGKSEVIEMSDKDGEQELINADNDDNNEYIDNDDNNEDAGQPKEELKKRRPTIRKKIDEVCMHFTPVDSSIKHYKVCPFSCVLHYTIQLNFIQMEKENIMPAMGVVVKIIKFSLIGFSLFLLQCSFYCPLIHCLLSEIHSKFSIG